MLTEFFHMNQTDETAQELKCLYHELPKYFVWHFTKNMWTKRSHRKIIGRIAIVSRNEGEWNYLRLLLSYVHAPTSFDDLLTVNGRCCTTAGTSRV